MAKKNSNQATRSLAKRGVGYAKLVKAISQVNTGMVTRAAAAVNQALVLRNWLIGAYIHEIVESNPADLVAIFQKILTTRKRTIFVSMPFGRTDTENHYTHITEVVADINRDYPDFKPPLTVKRVDFHSEGVSFPIRAKIDDFMANCGLLIANLTHFNPNVYHEVGFMDGKAKGENLEKPDVLLFLDESGTKKSQEVGFNLRGGSQIRFTRIDDFKDKLRKNLEKHFKLQP